MFVIMPREENQRRAKLTIWYLGRLRFSRPTSEGGKTPRLGAGTVADSAKRMQSVESSGNK